MLALCWGFFCPKMTDMLTSRRHQFVLATQMPCWFLCQHAKIAKCWHYVGKKTTMMYYFLALNNQIKMATRQWDWEMDVALWRWEATVEEKNVQQWWRQRRRHHCRQKNMQ